MFDDLIVNKKNKSVEGWTCVYCGNVKHKTLYDVLHCPYCKPDSDYRKHYNIPFNGPNDSSVGKSGTSGRGTPGQYDNVGVK